MTSNTVGRPRHVVAELPVYRPGKAAKQAEVEHGITGAIKLASNENPDPPLDPIVAAIVGAAATLNRYPDHRAVVVRQRVADWLGVDVAAVTVGDGSVGLLQQVFLSYVDPGDEVVYPWRSFETYPVFTSLMDGVAVTVPLTPALGYDVDGLIAAVTGRTKLVFLATPNNPTGTAMHVDAIAAVAQAVGESVVVVVDEAYHEFVDPALGDPVRDLVPQFANVLVTRTFSKAHGLAGARVGYAVGSPEVIATIDKTLLPFAVNSLAQVAVLAAIEHEHTIADRVQAIVRERSRVEAALRAGGWWLPDHQANFVWLSTSEATDAVTLALERLGVVARPFGGEGIRVTIGTAAENDRFLAALAELVAAGVVRP